MRAMWLPMELSLPMVLIVLAGVFLAGFMDGIAGGGGIVSVPAYFLAGLPSHLALGLGFQYAGFRLDASFLTASPLLGNTLHVGIGYTF